MMKKGQGNKTSLDALKNYHRELLAILVLLLAIVFFRSERKELHTIIPRLQLANHGWELAGIFVTILYIAAQAGIYRKSFAAVGLDLPFGNAIQLFLKRNLVSVFLPAGGISSLAYSPAQVRKPGFSKALVFEASALFGLIGLMTVFIAGLPVVLFTLLHAHIFHHAAIGLLALFVLLAGLAKALYSFKTKGRLYHWATSKLPSQAPLFRELVEGEIKSKPLAHAVLYSLAVEALCMLNVYVAMLALGVPASLLAAATGYIIAVLLMIISPFLRGLGAVELAMVYVLQIFGYTAIQALSIAILFRVFEFWLPLLGGLLAFAWKGRRLFLRLAPAVLTFFLGIVNIISVITPPLTSRLVALREYLPLGAIHASRLLVFLVGLSLLVTASYLLRGFRAAWVIALSLTVLSIIGHVTKALDYEESILATITLLVLIATSASYQLRTGKYWSQLGVKTAATSFASVLLFTFISFYFIDKRHFALDFSWQQAIVHSLKSFLLVEDTSLHPVTWFGREFIWLIRSLGFLTWGFLVFALLKPTMHTTAHSLSNKERAAYLLNRFGDSAIDYFKLYKDKLYFFSGICEAFIAYRIARGFAIVLEEPVCAEQNKIAVLREFDQHCRKMGLKTAFYRVDEHSMPWFDELKKYKLKIGQEALLEVRQFTLEGREQKSLRNGLNSLEKKGFRVSLHHPPHEASFLKELHTVSDEWLEHYHKVEMLFAQGIFDARELQKQDIICLKDAEGKVKAFLNIIPDYAEDECTYDLIRKTADAPAAAMDALVIRLIEYARENNKLWLNLGLVPMTGVDQPGNIGEHLIKMAAARIKRFQHYKGLREFKNKYATLWENKYLVFENEIDLVQLPLALNTVMKP
ncbi:phosphatidylglycerol lysyltransferase domain-containing protein [Flavisolibacter ginsengisoli]|uniref:Phosphatidylglycerol lysyltransferase n=1 Tax=Flavisolibacter ginsengisoli DSM 18119 TaxID=1121884 RepID=A0A1M5EJG7_9BACT|nr:phosphatidylglycerol lysyltransferase domain-containing protein [Flavisolibacter ginsengisoli]SHF79375.1 phosphatidylglycerol lysyltransferase [Flavisolibacter ginsengisoli DSM 18119]